jgi:hypothetical protein
MYAPDDIPPSVDVEHHVTILPRLLINVGDGTNCSNTYFGYPFSRDAKGGYPLFL